MGNMWSGVSRRRVGLGWKEGLQGPTYLQLSQRRVRVFPSPERDRNDSDGVNGCPGAYHASPFTDIPFLGKPTSAICTTFA